LAEPNVNHSAHRILILRPGAIGDTLLTFPALQLLRSHFPSATIEIVGNRPALRLAHGAGLVDSVDAFGADWVSDLFGDEPTDALRKRLGQVDLGIVWMHSANAAEDLAARLKAAGVSRAVPFVSFPPNGSQRHVADHLVDTLAEVGIPDRLKRDALTLSLWEREQVRPNSSEFCRARTNWFPLPLGEGQGEGIASAPGALKTNCFAVLHPGAGARRKRWPAERYAALAERLARRGLTTAVTSGPADEDAVASLQAALSQPIQVLAGLELRDLAAILGRASLVVGNDSGVTHLAALTGAPTLALFGPFDPAYWAPIGPHVAVLDPGRDCAHRQDPRDGCRECDHLARLEVDEVWAACETLLAASNAE
jgi:ADP-heptose:LPS heptosyltransferase